MEILPVLVIWNYLVYTLLPRVLAALALMHLIPLRYIKWLINLVWNILVEADPT